MSTEIIAGDGAVFGPDVLEAESHPVQRFTVATGIPYTEFRNRLEAAVPPFDVGRISELTERAASWEQISATVQHDAPNAFLVFAAFDSAALFAPAGDTVRAVAYLIGNHIIAESMFKHDPRAVLYAPLRLVVHDDATGQARLTFERPSHQFGSIGNDAVTAVGLQLDTKLADLLSVLGVESAARVLRAVGS